MMALRVSVEPAEEPVSLAEAKLHLRVDIDDDDTLISGLIRAARVWAEGFCRRAFVSQTLLLTLDEFPGEDRIVLPRPPLISVTHIKYTDSSGVVGTFAAASYFVDTESEPGRVVLKDGYSWPGDTLQVANGVAVTYVAGFGDADNVPESYKQAIKLLVGHWYENRENVQTTGAVPQEVPLGVQALLWMDRNW